jgi:CRP/FNR family cyclic AMP-dependent transcriptional regulator
MTQRTYPLDQVPLLAGLPEDDLQALVPVATVKSLSPGQPLIRAGETPAYMMIVLEGRLQAHEQAPDGRAIGLGIFNKGDAIGLLSMIDGLPINSTINAIASTDLLLIPIPVAQRLVLNRPTLSEKILTLLAAQVRRGLNDKAMLSLPNAFHRIFVQVNTLASETPTGHPLDQLPKQHELASIVNTSRETVSRALQVLVKGGVLDKVGHQIVIKQSDALQKLASDGPDALPDKN